jgi:hypothetical protein
VRLVCGGFASGGGVLAERVLEPRTFVGRAVGLLGRRELATGAAMWIRPCRSIHTLGMRFAIDAVFLDRRLEVVRVCRGVRPWRVVPLVWRARSVVELPAGTAAAVEVGDRLQVAG